MTMTVKLDATLKQGLHQQSLGPVSVLPPAS